MRWPWFYLIGVLAVAALLQAGFLFLGGENLPLPRLSGVEAETVPVWPPASVANKIRMGDAPVSGTPWLLAAPFVAAISLLAFRGNATRPARAAGWCGIVLGLVFLAHLWLFFTGAGVGPSGREAGPAAHFVIGYFLPYLALAMLVQIGSLVLLHLARFPSITYLALWANLLAWSATAVAWLYVLLHYPG